MPLSANTALSGGLKNTLLHGSDIPAKFDGVVARVKEIRQAPANFRAPFIIDFAEPLPYGCRSWPINMTNTAILAEKIGDDLSVITGKQIYLKKIKVENPQTGEEVYSLTIGKVEGEKAAKVDTKATKGKKSAKEARTVEGISEKDLPF